MYLPKGYSIWRTSEDLAILYSPEDVIAPDTGAYRGKRRVASFDPRHPDIELDVAGIAELDSYVRKIPTSVEDLARREVSRLELAGIFGRWRLRTLEVA